MGKYIYGIDFGTSNSVLAVFDPSKLEIVIVLSEASLIYFEDRDTIHIGKDAIQRYIDNNMAGRLLKSVKTLLPQSSFTFTYILGKKYTAEDLVRLILTFLKRQADEATGEDVTEVVLGRPVVFSEDPVKDKLAEKRLYNAARQAGFEKIWFQYEPIAAGFLYEQSVKEQELVLIGDFGGGTSDFTLMKLKKDKVNQKDRRSDIVKTGGIHIGGDDFDASIMWNKLVKHFGYGLQYESYGKMLDLPVHIYRTLCEWDQMGFLKDNRIRRQLDGFYFSTGNNPALKSLMTYIDYNLGFSLFQSIEKVKIELSAEESSRLYFDKQGIAIEERIELNDFNAFTKKELDKIESFLIDFLSEAKIEPQEIGNVFLTGGTSSLGSVVNLFKNTFSSEKINRGDNFSSVAQGLALSYLYLND